MHHFLFEDKEYKINPHFKRRRIKERDSARALTRLLRGKKSRHSSGGFGRIGKIDTRQKCAVKMQYSNSAEAHKVQLEKYLVREGTDIDGSRAKLYGTDIEEYRKNMTGKNFRIFLSPQSSKVNLTEMTKKFVMKLEGATGYKLYWEAANHYNTAHPHAHLLINGIDKNGNEVNFPRDVVKTFMREYARDICTGQLGSRTREELKIEKEQELSSPRYTRLDMRIKELCKGGFRVNLEGLTETEQGRILTRIGNLQKMNLCSYKDKGYKLSPHWEENLKANGRYNMFLKSRSVLKYSNPSSLKIYTGNEGEISGRVTKIYRTDGDASDNHAVVLEGLDGKAYFVPLMKKPEIRNKEERASLKEGELVTIKTYENQRGRLTPLIFRKEEWQIRKEIKKNGYTGSLAEAVLDKSFMENQKRKENVKRS